VVVSSAAGDLFDGPGEMRRLCRELDWAGTPLGTVRSWSPVLRSTVQLCLDSGFPILINWGPELVAVYNDAFTPLIGEKHPHALGRSAKALWPEAWDQVGTRLEDVLVRGRTLSFANERQILERHGYPEECYFTFSHSPVRDGDGTIVGLFTASTETTGQILNERRTRIMRDLGAISTADTPTLLDTCSAIVEVLSRIRETAPFAAAYLADPGGGGEVVAAYGFTADGSAGGGSGPGPVAAALTGMGVDRVLGTGETVIVEGLRDRFPGLLDAGPLGPRTPDQAVLMPLTVSGRSDPVGALVVGVNPYRPLDEPYRAFFSVVRRQVRVTLTDTVAYETERHRVRVMAELDHAKTEFFQNVSHELRTPLTLLLAPLQDLLIVTEKPALPAEDVFRQVRDTVQVAVRAADRLRLMVDALLEFSGAEVNRHSPDRQPADVGALTADLASMFRSTAEHAGLTFTVTVPDEPVLAEVDRAMWSTIVTNLVSNAVKYTDTGAVTVTLRAETDTAVLAVTDTGPGISEDERTRVFDRFHRAPAVEESGGSATRGAGIGLAVVADLVTAHDGGIDLASVPGAGSTFTVTIPITARAADAAGTDGQHAATLPSPRDQWGHGNSDGGHAGPRVLVVEDDADLRTYLTRLLIGDGWQVHAVPDAESALTTVTDSAMPAPDVVVTDIVLPGRDGLELVRELRANPTTSRLPVIVLTARGGPQAAAAGLAAGADDYLTKPFTTTELLARIRANHELHRLREHAVDAAENKADQIRNALESNRVIGTATGILMGKYRLTAAQGFALLVAGSQHTNRKLRDLAAEVADTQALPFRPTLTDELLTRTAQKT
jgi:signal transduction histidine kinase/DNA-binding response OmpR family regulator